MERFTCSVVLSEDRVTAADYIKMTEKLWKFAQVVLLRKRSSKISPLILHELLTQPALFSGIRSSLAPLHSFLQFLQLPGLLMGIIVED